MKRLPPFSNTDRSSYLGYGIFLLTVLVGYSALLTWRDGSPAQIALLIGLGVLYCILGVGWFVRFVRNTAPVTLYFVVQLTLATTIVYLGTRIGPNSFWIMPLPLVSHAFVLLSRARAIAVTALVVLLFGAVSAVNFGAQNALRNMLDYLTSAAFVAGFSWIAMEQTRGRLNMEALALELRDANQRLSEYALQVEELATTRERNRLAREVHDSLGHYLTIVNMQLEAARAMLPIDQAKTRDAINKAQSLTKEGLSEVRRSVAALRAGPMEKHSLGEAIALLVEETRVTGIETAYAQHGDARTVTPQAELLLYRAAQEGLTNMRKHSSATRARVLLAFEADRVVLTVSDNGQPKQTDAPSPGFGLLGLRERAELLGGVVSTQTSDGFVLRVEIPAP